MTPAEVMNYIESKKTKHGGFTKKQLNSWGLPWPPKKGWRKQLEIMPTQQLLKQMEWVKDHEQLPLL